MWLISVACHHLLKVQRDCKKKFLSLLFLAAGAKIRLINVKTSKRQVTQKARVKIFFSNFLQILFFFSHNQLRNARAIEGARVRGE
jgi:hypothetical protein